jgi:hypothetical protein
MGKLVRSLHIHQLDDLAFRNLIELPSVRIGPPSSEFRCLCVGSNGARIDYDPVRSRTSYSLPSGHALYLRPGEVELLLNAGYPGDMETLFAVLWRRIAPRDPAPLTPTGLWLQAANQQLATLQALVQKEDVSPAELLAEVRTFLQAAPFYRWDALRRQNARDSLLQVLLELVNGKKFIDLIDAVAELQAAEETPED